MKKFLSIIGASCVSMALVACTSVPTDNSGGSSLSSEMAVTSSEGETVRVITVTASNFAFSPNTIRVKKGEKVRLHLVGESGIHGFGVADLGINVSIPEGGSVDVDLPTDTAGTFSFRCTIPCGSGHMTMTGTIIVE